MKDGVYKIKEETVLPNGIIFKSGQELEVVGGVLYMDGHPLAFNFQVEILSWMKNNTSLLKNDTRNY